MKSIVQFPFYAKASLVIIGLFCFIAMLFIAQQIIVPIIYSIIIAIVLNPVVNFFVRKKVNRVAAIAIAITLVIVATIFIILILSSQMMLFSDSFPKLIEKFHQLLDQSIVWASAHFNISTSNINVWINEKNAEILKGTSSAIGQMLINTGSVLIVLVLIPVYVFMLLFYQPLLIAFIHRLFKSNNQTEVNEILKAIKKIIQSYLVGLLLEAAIIAILNATALLIIGIDYAILLGVIGAIVNVIPYIGGIVAVALPMMIALATKSTFSCLLVFVVYVFIQFVDNHYIIPKVVASKVKINALISVIVVLAFGALWGIPGMLLSIPLTAIIKVIFDNIDSLKPWGYLLGDTLPKIVLIKLKLKNK